MLQEIYGTCIARELMGEIRPSSKPICDQQFLGEAQSSTAAY
ncbi:hypothetical protein [Cardinium endosymbiont of Dermatophagoides farinae]|nr:hypothetical protein [Cardinium endosymbiont of Dermatophagoides farinae]